MNSEDRNEGDAENNFNNSIMEFEEDEDDIEIVR